MMTKPNEEFILDELDQRLLALLRKDARQPVTSLAHALNISRGSVYSRMTNLKRRKVIARYTVELGQQYGHSLIRAHIMIKVSPKAARLTERQLVALPNVTDLHAISGEYDLIAIVEADDVTALNQIIDRIGELAGVAITTSSILLDTKVLR